MATNILVVESLSAFVGTIEDSYRLTEYDGLALSVLAGRPVVAPYMPTTSIYVGQNQSFRQLGLDRDGVHCFAFSFNSADHEYYHGPDFVTDLRYLRDTHHVDLSSLHPLGYVMWYFSSNSPSGRDGWQLNPGRNDILLTKIQEASRG